MISCQWHHQHSYPFVYVWVDRCILFFWGSLVLGFKGYCIEENVTQLTSSCSAGTCRGEPAAGYILSAEINYKSQNTGFFQTLNIQREWKREQERVCRWKRNIDSLTHTARMFGVGWKLGSHSCHWRNFGRNIIQTQKNCLYFAVWLWCQNTKKQIYYFFLKARNISKHIKHIKENNEATTNTSK